MVVRPFVAQFPKVDEHPTTTAFFQQAKADYPRLQQEGLYHTQTEEAMYAYEIQRPEGTKMRGLIAAVSVHDYLEERVRKHENTLVPKEEKQAELLLERQAFVKPVLLAHRPHQGLAELLDAYCEQNKALHRIIIEDTREVHSFWPITRSEDIASLQQYFSQQITTTYIADGHHRFSAAARLYQRQVNKPEAVNYTNIMCVFMPSTTLEIHNFNRIIKAFQENLSPLAFMAKLSHYAEIEPLADPANPEAEHELTCYMEGEWFRLRWREDIIEEYAHAGLPIMDVSMLNYCILEEILQFENIRSDKRIKYVEGLRGLEALQELTDNRPAVAFCLYPLSWEAFFLVIDHGLVLPPKSTWFEPRMLNGLIVQPF